MQSGNDMAISSVLFFISKVRMNSHDKIQSCLCVAARSCHDHFILPI